MVIPVTDSDMAGTVFMEGIILTTAVIGVAECMDTGMDILIITIPGIIPIIPGAVVITHIQTESKTTAKIHVESTLDSPIQPQETPEYRVVARRFPEIRELHQFML